MLELKDIKKDYVTGDSTVSALKGISLQFRDSEFVAILGQSGCGKTTLLNIVGGLDQYTSGDLVINGVSTKKYMDADWDAYRNHSVGFVFQSYNLIPHQTVLANVELALTLSGVSKYERRKRATAALEQVGLGDQLHKKPNQMSGGQMQRVAIARALVNNPSIVLADEPTGALDTETSVQVMEILKEVSKDRLVIMVTHNPDLAEEYASRIVRLKDGVILSDSQPYVISEEERIAVEDRAQVKQSKTSMSLLTALGLSFNNLMTKKARTLLTAFAGSIGIIGIALILSLSDGAQNYIQSQEEAVMGSYPITISESTIDLSSMMSGMTDAKEEEDAEGEAAAASDEEVVTSKEMVTDMVTTTANGAEKNDMAHIKEWLESNPDGIDDYLTDIQYSYDLPINIYSSDTSDGPVQVNPSTVMSAMGFETSGSTQSALLSSMASSGSSYDVFDEMLENEESVDRDLDLVAGRMPESYDELLLVTDKDGRISDYTLYALGLMDQDDLTDMMRDVVAGKDAVAPDEVSYTYDELLDLEFKIVLEADKYAYNEDDGIWESKADDDDYMAEVIDEKGETLKIVGIAKATEDNNNTYARWGYVLYTHDLIEHLVDETDDTEIVKQQLADSTIDVFSGYAFPSDDEEEEWTMDYLEELIGEMGATQGEMMQQYIDQMRDSGMSDDEIVEAFQSQMKSETSNATYDGNLETLGVVDLDEPSGISLYADDFDAKEHVTDILTDYNDKMKDSGRDSYVIHYTDLAGMLMSSMTTIINAITYILIAFVAISLVVSSIMIGIITYISVLERTKEIGVLRAIGASKRDVTRVFNAETFIIGLFSGLLGVGVTVLLDIPINMIIDALADVQNMAAVPMAAGIVLVIISVLLTLIGGAIPSSMAAKKDPVIALRTE